MKKYFALSGSFMALFLLMILIVKTVDVAPIGAEGTEIGLASINGAVHEFFGVHIFYKKLTDLMAAGSIGIVALFAFVGLFQWIRRKSLFRVDHEILSLGGIYVLLFGFYLLFEKTIVNYRPIVMPGEVQVEASFPSSHTMLFCVITGCAIVILKKYVKNLTLRRVLYVICWVTMPIAVLCRLASGVHWFSDILGGVLISLALIFLYAGLTLIDRKSNP